MILAKIRVSGIDANLVEWKEVPAGIRGAQVAFEYADPTWDGLEKTVVFRGCVTRDVLRAGTLVEIPPECVETPGAPLKVGVYGTDPDNAVAIPTLWADLGRVKSAADPSGDESAGDGLPVWAQILALIGDLDDLGTAAKDTLVAAINEAATKGGGSVSEEEVWDIVDRYLQEHPVTVAETDPTVPSWAKQPQKPTYTAAEVGARPASWMPSASDVGADPAGTAAAAFSGHNTAVDAHNDIRLDLKKINDKLTAFFDSDDQTLDELSEIVAYITSNKSLIDAITTSKVSVSDIIDNLTTNSANRPLSAAQGVVLNGLISTVSNNLSKYQPKGDYALRSEIPAKLPNPNALTINGTSYDGSTPVSVIIEGGSDAADVQAIIEQYLKDHPVVVTETDPTVPSWAKQPQKPTYTAAEVGARPASWMPSASDVGARPASWTPSAADVGADPAGTAAAAVSGHNTATDAHNDIRLDLKKINDKLTAFFDSDDQTLDELSEIVAYITSNKSLIDAITTSKVSVSDIIDNLTTNVANRPLSAAQGVVLNGLISTVSSSLSNYQPKGDYALKSEIPTKLPNPFGLFINNRRYDGYTAVDMDLQERICDAKPGATLAENVSVTSGNYAWVNYHAVKGYEKMRVIYDGVTYDAPITFGVESGDPSDPVDARYFYVGNVFNLAPEYPFSIVGYAYENGAEITVGSGTHTMSVILDPFVKKIDKKFLPDDIGGVDWDIIPKESYTMDEGAYHSFGEGFPALVNGKRYIVTIDGVEYERIAKYYDDGDWQFYYIGNIQFWEPSAPADANNDIFFLHGFDQGEYGSDFALYLKNPDYANKTVVFGVREKKDSGSTGGGVSSWNDLTDKPFHNEEGTEKIDVECLPEGYPYIYGPEIDPYFDGSLTGREVFPLGSGTSLVKVTEYVLTEAQCIGQTFELTANGQSMTSPVTEDMITELTAAYGISLFAIVADGTPAVAVVRESGTVQGIAVSAGTYYFHYAENGATYYVSHFSGLPEDDGAQKMDSRLLPAVGCNSEPFFVSDTDNGGAFKSGSYTYFRANKKMKEQMAAGIIKISFYFIPIGGTEATRVTAVLTGDIEEAYGVVGLNSKNPEVPHFRYSVCLEIGSGTLAYMDIKPLLAEGPGTVGKRPVVQNDNGVYVINVDSSGNVISEKFSVRG